MQQDADGWAIHPPPSPAHYDELAHLDPSTARLGPRGLWPRTVLPPADDYHPLFEPDPRVKDRFDLCSGTGHLFSLSFSQFSMICDYLANYAIDDESGEKPALIWQQAETDTLALVLLTLLPHGPGHLRASETDPLILLQHFRPALDLSRRYAFPRFYPAFHDLLDSLHAPPFERFAIASIASDQTRATEQAKLSVLAHPGSIPESIIDLLHVEAPSYLDTLVRMHATYAKLIKAFKHDLDGVNIHLDGFGTRCKRRFGRGCEAFIRSRGKFSNVREWAATAAIRVIATNDARTMCQMIQEAIHDAIGCETCAHRVINAFDAVMRSVFRLGWS
ncbi:hypothetical protein IAU60_005313 [Kwoniella sp. DSM 27419]